MYFYQCERLVSTHTRGRISNHKKEKTWNLDKLTDIACTCTWLKIKNHYYNKQIFFCVNCVLPCVI